MASVAYSSCTTTSSSSSSSIQCFLPRLPLPCSSSSSSAPATITTSLARRRIKMTDTTTVAAAALSFFPTTFLVRGSPFLSLSSSSFSSSSSIRMVSSSPAAAAAASASDTTYTNTNPSIDGKRKESEEEEEVEEVEEDMPWIQEKALGLVEFTGSVTQAIPGPRIGRSSLPWILAIPLAYVGISFVIAFVKTVRKFNSPKEIRRKLVNKNALLCKLIDELLEKGRDGVQQSDLKELMQKTDFGMEEILRKYIRYALNEKPFNPDFVANLIQLRKASSLDDSQVAEILNEISRRIFKDKGNSLNSSLDDSQVAVILNEISRRIIKDKGNSLIACIC